MYDTLFFIGLFAAWIILNAWVLPWFGIHTCMSGACRVPHAEQDAPLTDADHAIHMTKTGRG